MVRNNTVTDYGGGLLASAGRLTVSGIGIRVMILDNSAGGRGGGLHIEIQSNVFVDRGALLAIRHNVASDGGGLSNAKGATYSLRTTTQVLIERTPRQIMVEVEFCLGANILINAGALLAVNIMLLWVVDHCEVVEYTSKMKFRFSTLVDRRPE